MSVVDVVDAGDVRTIRLNRPERLNALGARVLSGLEDVVLDTSRSPTRVVVLEGTGRAFSAGADLRGEPGGAAAGRAPASTWQSRRRDSGRWQRLLDAFEALPQPTVGSLHGYVIGGGALLAVACDLRVAAPDTTFSIPELAIGIPLTWGGLPRLVREVGLPRTRELVMTGRRLDAQEALAWGLVHRVGDREAETKRLVDELLAMPEAPLAMTKDAMRAYGRMVSGLEAAWADADLISWSRVEEESTAAAVDYNRRLAERRGKRSSDAEGERP